MRMEVHDTNTLCEIVKRLNKLNQQRVKANKNTITLRAAAGCIVKSEERISAFSKLSSDCQYQDSFSVSPCVEAHVILHLVGEEFDKIIINGVMVTVGCNVQIGPLEATLYHNKPGLSLPVSPLIPWVTLVGLAANAGHGTGLNQPAIAGLIESITMVKANGKLKTITKDDADFDVINGAHLGLFGLVTEVTIKCIPACKLKATTYAWSLNEFFRQVEEKKLYETNEYVSVMYIPTYWEPNKEREYRNVSVLVAKQVSIERNNVNWTETEQGWYDTSQLLEMETLELINKCSILSALRFSPLVIPWAMRLIAGMKLGIIHTSPVETTGPFYQIAHYQRQFPRELDDIDFLFPVKEPREMLKVLETIINTLEKYRAKGYYPVSFAIYIRMFKGTNGGLSTSSHQQDEYIAAIDIVTDPRTPHYQLPPKKRKNDQPNKFKEDIQQYFMDPTNKLHAKPHWGKTLPAKADYAMMYGDNFKQFMRVAENWYKDTGCTFDTNPFMNSFFKRIFNIEVSEAIREVKLTRVFETTENYSLAIDEKRPMTDKELRQLQEYATQVENELVKNHYIIRPPKTSFYRMAIPVDKSQAAENYLPYIGLYCRATDPNILHKQQREIQKLAERFLQEVNKAVENATEKKIADKTTEN
ncbi:unnamed protein product [Rotaria sp. Silwood1]|nr:unnamed protein product [Rotaria sp. Silwood1]CAF4940679.1 unnamed protein product [Rotaria sp. Silwood1]